MSQLTGIDEETRHGIEVTRHGSQAAREALRDLEVGGSEASPRNSHFC